MKNIFVGNLAYGATEDTVRSLFEAYGSVGRVSLIVDRTTGQPKRFGFIEMASMIEAEHAIAALNGAQVGGAPIRVKEVPPREHRRFRGAEYRVVSGPFSSRV